MLVAAFKIEIGRIGQLVGVRASHHGHVGCTGVKPHVERVFGLLVHFRFHVREFSRCQARPRFDNLHRFRMKFAGFFMNEEGQGNAPVSLTGNTPVRAIGDHVVETHFAPFRNELGCFNSFQGGLTQRIFRIVFIDDTLSVRIGFVHADKPLVGGAINQRCLMAPAVHVAVHDFAAGQQVAGNGNGVEDLVLSFPNIQAAEERQRGGILTVALDRVQDLVVGEACALAGNVVIHTVGRSRVNNTGTGSGLDVVGEQNRGEAVVERIKRSQRMLEAEALESFALGFGDDFAFHAVALEGFFIEAFGKNEAAVRSFNENILQIRMHVQSLVGRNGPGCRCPNNDCGGFFQFDPEDAFELAFVLIGNREGNV